VKKNPVIVGLLVGVILSVLCPLLSAHAQEAAQKGKVVATRGVVFHVKGKEGGEIWLAGSVHMLRASDYPLPAAYTEAYAAAKQVVFEIPPSDLQSAESMAIIQRSILYLDGSTLTDHLSPDGLKKLTSYTEKQGLPMAQLQALKPWMLAQMIVLQEFSKQGFKPELGLDAHFETKATKDGKTIKGLETVAFQMGLFAGLPEDQQEEMLISTLDDLGDAKDFIDRLLGAWAEGDPEKVSEVMNEAMEGDPALGKAILYDRNKNWISPIEEMMKSKTPTMIIVGAGHLCGKGSVIELLQKAGHQVDQK
jgi:uncharacterized protein YbaP (TraB family)